MRNLKYIIAMIGLGLAVSACDSYLDRQSDEALTEEKIWEKKATAEQYLYTVYSYMPQLWNQAGENGWVGASDEGAFTATGQPYYRMINGNWGPDNVTYAKWFTYYRGIREATYFMQNVDRCPELTSDEKGHYKAEARFLRAFYYWRLMKLYGPVILLGEDLVNFAAGTNYNIPRNTWEECVDFVVTEMETAAKGLPDDYSSNWLGKTTSGAALAVKSQVLLLSASPLYNSDRSVAMYASVKNPDGTPLFPTKVDKEKWFEAAKAAKAVIDLGRYELNKEYTKDATTGEDVLDPCASLYGIFHTKWNKELILARTAAGNESFWALRCMPNQVGTAYGIWCITQEQVDAYAMDNGKYPIEGYNSDGTPQLATGTGYSEQGFTAFKNPRDNFNAVSTFNMYVNREPRFYVDVAYNNMLYPYDNDKSITLHFHTASSGSSGPGSSHDYCKTGYLIRKGIDPANDPKNGRYSLGSMSWPIIRLAEIYLNYTEALIEYGAAGGAVASSDIFEYWDLVRERAGLKSIKEVYPEAIGDYSRLRDLIRRERRVELAFESNRFFDTRRWLIAEQTDGGDIHSMNVEATSSGENSAYWKRVVLEKRVFTKKHYLFPLAAKEIELDNSLVQNYGW